MNWESLPEEDKIVVEEYGQREESDLELYKPFLDAMKLWKKIQDTQGNFL